jgi:threonine/homoserine/homoserine lactone efflux protein
VLQSLGAFLALSAVVICTPGQDTALTIRNTLSGGRRSGIATAAGVSLGQAVWTLAASAGLVALLSASEPAFRALKLAGAAYLVYLGAHTIWTVLTRRGAADSTYQIDTRTNSLAPRRALRQGLVSNLGNPKMAIFFASLLPQFAPEADGAFAVLLALGLLFCTLTLAWLSLYAVAVARLSTLLTGQIRRAIDVVTGVVLVAFGIRLAADER